MLIEPLGLMRLNTLHAEGTLTTAHIHAAALLYGIPKRNFTYHQLEDGKYMIGHGVHSLVYKIENDANGHITSAQIVIFIEGEEIASMNIDVSHSIAPFFVDVGSWQQHRLDEQFKP